MTRHSQVGLDPAVSWGYCLPVRLIWGLVLAWWWARQSPDITRGLAAAA